MNKPWSTDDSCRYYNIPNWSNGYFALNTAGEVVVKPQPENSDLEFSLPEICRELANKNFQLPALLRFPDILKHRVTSLCQAFNRAIQRHDYKAEYSVCYPIKVNQQKRVVESLLSANKSDNIGAQVGLEAGSKPELMAVLALSEHSNSVIVCNGYKDREYIRLALIGQQLGHKVFIVIEKLSELDLLLEEADKLRIKPAIGIRARLTTQGQSKWQNSGGDDSKFGLTAGQILRVIEKLEFLNQLDIFELLHFHLGSQITSISDIQSGLKECARFYSELRQLGVGITTLDVGGGLGVDYDGTASQNHCSIDYSLDDYANAVVSAFNQACQKHQLPCPNIISESGRALTAHHAVLIANVIDREEPELIVPSAPSKHHASINQLWNTYNQLVETAHNNQETPVPVVESVVESVKQAAEQLRTIQRLFNEGAIGLFEKANSERMYRLIRINAHKFISQITMQHTLPDALIEFSDQLQHQLATKYFVNFSLFQSLPDAWAIDQIFPILSLSNLNQRPTFAITIQDITCDSDGQVKQYVNNGTIETVLSLPPFAEQQPIHLGFFMVGAYQEILGDMHNLFGDTHTVDLELNANNELSIVATSYGSGVDELLEYVDYNPSNLLESYKRQLKSQLLDTPLQRQYLAELRQGVHGYCYLED